MRCSFVSLCTLPVFDIICILLATSAATQTHKVIDLGTFSGDDRSAANSINDAGDGVGVSVTSGQGDPVVSPNLSHAFINMMLHGKSPAGPGAPTARSAFEGRRESSKTSASLLMDLEASPTPITAGRSSAQPIGMQPALSICRHSSNRFDKWEDLNSMIPANSGWRLNIAQAMNDRDEMAGTGKINGASHAFLLKPV